MKRTIKLLGLIISMAMTITSLAACSTAAEVTATTTLPAEITVAENETTATETESMEPLKIAYIVNFASHEFYQNIIKGAQAEADERGVIIEFQDANLDINKQISMGETLLTKGIDALIITPVDAKGVMPLIDQALAANIPVITESVKAENQTCYVGIDDFEGGYLDGKFAGQWLIDANFTDIKCLLVGLPALEACVNRTEGFKKGLLEIIPDAVIAVEVDGQGSKDKAMAVSTDALTANPGVNVIMGINDDSTLGGVQAYLAGGGDPTKLAAFGFGVEGIAAKNELSDSASPYQGGLAMFPENIGRLLVDAAIKAANGETVPTDIQVPFDVMTKDNVSKYYTKNGDSWDIIWSEVLKLGN